MKKNGFTLIELIIIIAIVGILASIVFSTFCSGGISDGDRVGIITKLSNKGIWIKTWEGQMILGGQGTVTTNVWEFSLGKNPDPKLLDGVRAALDSQQRVKLTYHQYMITRHWLGDTSYFITKLEPIK